MTGRPQPSTRTHAGDRLSSPGRRRRGNEGGSVTILVAAVLLMTGVLALASVDLLRALEAKSRAQTAADAAALAAAQEMVATSGSDPSEVAGTYATRNGASLVDCRCSPGGAEAIVRVTVPIELVFVGPDRTITGRARAVIEGR